jgi:hypothetical protein
LAVAHQLGHVLMGEQEERFSLLQRLVEHAMNTARFNIYYGESRDAFDVRGRTAHETVFNVTSGVFRCPNSQQGYSPFSTWTRGLAWAICGFAELLEFMHTVSWEEFEDVTAGGRWTRDYRTLVEHRRGRKVPRFEPTLRRLAKEPAQKTLQAFENAATATADFYLENCCADGIPMWDTGAPNLHGLGNYLSKPADPFNHWEPIDSSAAAIAAQGLWRLGNYLDVTRKRKHESRTRTRTKDEDEVLPTAARIRHYRQAALTIANTLFDEPYLSTNPKHQGLILHSVYHRPNGWDYIAPRQRVPNGESSMWGDYHARELALLLLREAQGKKYLTFFSCLGAS